jgi:molecular chaperone HscB
MKTHFDTLGIARAFHISSVDLEKKFLELSRQNHPDKFAKAGPRERLESVQRTTALNDAYRVLKDPVRRAEYLLKLEGLDVADEKNSVKASPELLGDMMERNEALAEARSDGDTAKVEVIAGEVRLLRDQAMKDIEDKFHVEPPPYAEIAQLLISLRYFARLHEQVEAFESGAEAREKL